MRKNMQMCFFSLPGVQNMITFDEPTCPHLKSGTDQIESKQLPKMWHFSVFPKYYPDKNQT